jgi:hypothetical protein
MKSCYLLNSQLLIILFLKIKIQDLLPIILHPLQEHLRGISKKVEEEWYEAAENSLHNGIYGLFYDWKEHCTGG